MDVGLNQGQGADRKRVLRLRLGGTFVTEDGRVATAAERGVDGPVGALR